MDQQLLSLIFYFGKITMESQSAAAAALSCQLKVPEEIVPEFRCTSEVAL